MMRRLTVLLTAVFALLTVSCNNKSDETDPAQTAAPVRVSVQDFSVAIDDFGTRAVDVAGYEGVKALTLAFYDTAGNPAYSHTQLRGDATTYTDFGQFSLSLPLGTYTMVVLGHGLSSGEPAITLTSPTEATFGDYPVRETFSATQTVTIASYEAVALSAKLTRMISKLQVISSDPRDESVQKVLMTFSAGGKSFNPTTGLATSDAGFSNTVAITSAAGKTSTSNSYLFLSTDEQKMDVTIQMLDAQDNPLYTKHISDVPFQRNRVTKLTGSLYTNESLSASFQIDSDWLPAYEASF
jgi:hypothetical protein